uniref:Family with sequence similarity 50 member A n=2 Tax=Sus scrofa TaxID=9823 RepID=A0A8D1V5N1_PIG
MAQYKGAASEAGRAMHLMKKREKQREQMEQMKQRIAEENIMKSNIDKKFSAHYDAVEAELKSSTVGLVTLNDMKAKQEALVKEREKQLAKKEQSKELQLKLEKLREKERKKEAKRKISSLSFTLEEEEEAGEEEEAVAVEEEELEREEVTTKKRKLGKNPDVDTSFLPDRDREEEENRLREELRQEWEAKQEKIKSEEIEITFSYWDGSGHRRTVKMKKGNTMQQFLQKALEILRKDFSELRWGRAGGCVCVSRHAGPACPAPESTVSAPVPKTPGGGRGGCCSRRAGPCAAEEVPRLPCLGPGRAAPSTRLRLAVPRRPAQRLRRPVSSAGCSPSFSSLPPLPQVRGGGAAHVHQGGPDHSPRECPPPPRSPGQGAVGAGGGGLGRAWGLLSGSLARVGGRGAGPAGGQARAPGPGPQPLLSRPRPLAPQLLRLHRHQGTRQERAPLQFRRA